MQRGEVWFASVPGGGDRPVLILTRDPVADRIGHLVVGTLTRTRRNLVSELPLGPEDGMPVECVVSFDNLRTLPRESFRRKVTTLSDQKMAAACRTLRAALGCS
jgi:mRNA interferase MazF